MMCFVHDQYIALGRIAIEERHESKVNVEAKDLVFTVDLPE